MAKYIANILTICRIIGSILLLFLHIFSVAFYITYLICGFSDMADGAIARKTNSASKFGSKLDSIADIIFVVISTIKLLPSIRIPGWLFVWAGVIAVIRISNIMYGYISRKEFVSMHTIMNKITGLLLFLLPLSIPFWKSDYIVMTICFIATLSAIQEGLIITKTESGKSIL